jgi:hypothetical protein
MVPILLLHCPTPLLAVADHHQMTKRKASVTAAAGFVHHIPASYGDL